jgi:hypothetical protein
MYRIIALIGIKPPNKILLFSLIYKILCTLVLLNFVSKQFL